MEGSREKFSVCVVHEGEKMEFRYISVRDCNFCAQLRGDFFLTLMELKSQYVFDGNRLAVGL